MSVTNLFNDDDPTIASRYLAGQLTDAERAAYEAELEKDSKALRELEATARLKVGLERLRETGQLDDMLRPTSTGRQIMLYSLGLVPVSLLPTFLGMSGRIYFSGALLLGVGLLYVGGRLARFKMAPDSAHSKQRARQLLQATVFYLPLLFALMMLNTRQ